MKIWALLIKIEIVFDDIVYELITGDKKKVSFWSFEMYSLGKTDFCHNSL